MRIGQAMRAIGLVAALSAAVAAQAGGIMDLRNGDTVMFMGDSITVFGQAWNGGYVRLVEKALQAEGVEIRKVVNAGCGYQSPTMVAHCLPRLTEVRPDVMTFSCGVNDVLHTFCPPAPGRTGTGLEAYKKNVARIFDEADRLGTRVIVLTTTMLREDETNAMNRAIAPYNDFLRAEASRRGYRLADVNKAHREQLRKVKKGDRDKGWLACYDGIHMAEAGNRMMAVEVLKAMGVPADDFPKVEAAWADMRGERPFVSAVSGPVRPGERVCVTGGGWSWGSPFVEMGGRKIKPDGVSNAEFHFLCPTNAAAGVQTFVVLGANGKRSDPVRLDVKACERPEPDATVRALERAVVDPAAFGLRPSAAPSVNVAALQKALDGGNRTVRVTEPGVYNLDKSIYLDSDTVFECGPGVVFRRAASYPNMFVNRGAWNYHSNSNITVRGLHISINDMGMTPGYDTPCPGLRGQVAFYNVSRIRVYDFKCLDLAAMQYCVQFAGFEDVVIDGFEIRGRKDGIHLNCGKTFVIRNGCLETGDDGIALNAGDWPVTCTPVMGPIENGVVENVHDMPGGRCNFARVITGCWKEWHAGIRLQRGDIFTIGRNVYAVALPKISTNEFVSLTPPTHVRGVWTSPEGIPFLWLQGNGARRADIRNVVFRDCFLHSKRGVSCSWEVGDYARLIHPEIERKDYPVIDITLDNVVSDSGATLVGGNASATLRLFNCRSAGPLVCMGGGHVSCSAYDYPTDRTVLVNGCTFGGSGFGGPDLSFWDPTGTVRVFLNGNLQQGPVRISAACPEALEVSGDSDWVPVGRRVPMTAGGGAESVESRVEGLLSRMTLREKAGQLSQQPLYDAKSAEKTREARRRGEIGSYILFDGPRLRNEVQRDQVEHSRLGIPLMFGADVLHGESVAFPSPCSLACSFEPELFERCQAVAAREARAAGVDWVFAPMCDLARDIRWGRIVETCGEDPYLSALCNAAQVRGFQGPDNDVADPTRVAACLKHFVGYSSVVGGRDHCESTVSEWELRNFHLPSFRAGVAAGAKTVMSAFNTIDGRPAVMCRHTLTDVLRGEWGFNGFVVSDWGSVAGLVKWGVARDAAEATRLALSAGNDMDMCTGSYVDSVERLVASGKLSVRTLDESVRKVLRVKFALGLFERPYCDADRYEALYAADRAREAALAREAGRKCAVLLKNEDGILPLAADRARKIALIGPFADDHDEMRGSWAANTMHTRLVTLREGLADGLPAGMSFEYAKGCDILDRPLTRIRTDAVEEKVGDESKASGEEELAAAMAAVGRSDLVILAIGETRRWSGEGGSRCDLGLTGRQQELFDAAAASGKPVVAVIFSGRPLILPKVYDQAKAVLFAGQPGCEAGHAVADLLFGRFSPSGRLSVSIPRGIGWVPMNYNGATTGHPDGTMRYRDSGKAHGAAYPFGFGLSYATFAYSPVTVDAKADGTCEAVCRIRNTGAVAAIETPQLYIRSEACSEGWRPARELRGFRRVSLRPGESAEVRFPISNKTLGFVTRQGRDRTEAGTYKIWIAPDSVSGKPADLEWNVR